MNFLRSIFAVNIDDSEQRRRRQKMQEEQRQRQQQQGEGGQKPAIKRATDDYHYDKFRKQFRRY